MKLLIIRHGPAGDREKWEAEGKDDRLRPLTAAGGQEMREATDGLTLLAPSLPIIATSPLLRAAATAAIVGSSYKSEVINLDELSPESTPDDLVPWLRDRRQETVAVVGHEPHLSTLAGYLLTGASSSFMDLKKGGACLLEFRGAPAAGGGVLHWLLTRRELQRMGNSR